MQTSARRTKWRERPSRRRRSGTDTEPARDSVTAGEEPTVTEPDPLLDTPTAQTAAAPRSATPKTAAAVQYVAFEPTRMRRVVIIVLLLFVGLELAQWAFYTVGSFLFLILLAWLLAIAMEPAIMFFARRGMRRGLATGLVMLVLVVAVLGVMAVFGQLFLTQLSGLVTSLPMSVGTVVDWLNRTFHLAIDPNTIVQQLNLTSSSITGMASTLAGGFLGVLGSLLTAVFDVLTILVFAFYLAADGPRLRRTIGSWLPPDPQRVFVTVWDIALDKTGGFVISKVVLAGLSALAHTGFFWLVNVPYWLPMGLFAGITSQFIPTIGTYIGILVPVLFTVFTQPITAIWIVAFATVYQQIENYLFMPRVSRMTMDVHPAIALASVFIGAAFFGPIGAIIGIPLAAAVLAVVNTYGQRYELVPELSTIEKGEKPGTELPPVDKTADDNE